MSETEETKGNKCPYCDLIIPDDWTLQEYPGYICFVNSHNQYTHRHNLTFNRDGENYD